MTFHRSLILAIACCGALFAQNAVLADPHESPASPVNAGDGLGTRSKGSNGSPTLIGGASLNAQDRMFIREAAKAGQTEVNRAQMMADHASALPVKDFAQKLVTDHTAGNQELASVAQGKGVTIPVAPATPPKLKPMSDKAYIASEVLSHRKAIDLFEKEAALGLDASMRTFASKTLPALQEHLKMAKSLQSASATPVH